MAVTVSTAFSSGVTAALSDNQIEKKEGQKLRKLALKAVDATPEREAAMKLYRSEFQGLKARAADAKAKGYFTYLDNELARRAVAEKQARQLFNYIKRQNPLAPGLEFVDLSDPKKFASTIDLRLVVSVQIPLKRGADQQTINALFDIMDNHPTFKKIESWTVKYS